MLATPKLLITDDDAALRESLAAAFSRRGIEVALAEDGRRGLEIARREGIHLALVDYQMPRLSGLEMMAELREWRPELPCILMSAALDEAVRREAERMRVYGMMSKPLRLSQIDRLVRDALRKFYAWEGNDR
jgi:DNA-binding NtrC family response regulator